MKEFVLNISVSISSNQGDHLQVMEQVTINANDFLDLAKVLGQFHDLAQAVKISRKVPR